MFSVVSASYKKYCKISHALSLTHTHEYHLLSRTWQTSKQTAVQDLQNKLSERDFTKCIILWYILCFWYKLASICLESEFAFWIRSTFPAVSRGQPLRRLVSNKHVVWTRILWTRILTATCGFSAPNHTGDFAPCIAFFPHVYDQMPQFGTPSPCLKSTRQTTILMNCDITRDLAMFLRRNAGACNVL